MDIRTLPSYYASTMPTKTEPQRQALVGGPDSPEVFETIGDDLLTPAQVARGFRVSSHTIVDWRNRKSLPYVRLSGARKDMIAFRDSKVRAWAKQHGLTFDPPVRD